MPSEVDECGLCDAIDEMEVTNEQERGQAPKWYWDELQLIDGLVY